ncbi:hypothetical protein EV643_105124 [Kribbella sp. VKM Ac-2527]|uniref:Uncharacterized protein n=1 Tax=Kribbella caucasensis TaxID=2512215 RepID=A0A4R6KK13_9ACTN|nr:cell division protein FtsK [Kribbella sp. VKM Ac-2527]TDO49896.1 hypothetical protein EV643_105124 [Kribbella sp. VKM Ac-2527]
MLNAPLLLSRRVALQSAALAAGVVLVAGCDDAPAQTAGTPGASAGPDGSVESPTPSTDPAVVAALTTAAAQVVQIAQRYGSVSKTYPALRTQLTTAMKCRAAHLAKLTEVGGFETPQPVKPPALPKTAAAALAELMGREQKLSVAHATAATKLTGEPARLLAMLAASESQLAATLVVKKKAAQ